MAASLQDIGYTMGNAIYNLGTYSANAASRANAVSKAAQNAAANFNQTSVNNANTITSNNLAAQY